MSPPNLPTPDFFLPLGKLLEAARRGQRFVAVTVQDIKRGGWRPCSPCVQQLLLPIARLHLGGKGWAQSGWGGWKRRAVVQCGC